MQGAQNVGCAVGCNGDPCFSEAVLAYKDSAFKLAVERLHKGGGGLLVRHCAGFLLLAIDA
jgi:hypothetical protein